MKNVKTASLLRFSGVLAAAALLLPVAASAGSATGTLSVSASVSQNCTIAAASLGFGSYDPIVANVSAALNASQSLTFTCTKGSTPVYVTANTGSNGNSGGACSTTRSMKSGSNVLCYELYTDSNHTNVWNTTNNGTNDYQPTFASSHTATATVYGQIPGAQDATVGASYTDSVTMTINF